ncbi:hypothetical protein LCGC14_2451410 [marine sediment metagenome]|uniref:Uncharacterized protein n=1 Tax=marine sediment metagenome TaxID=412755 RepID=A0A0F9BG10_9ZZZZ
MADLFRVVTICNRFLSKLRRTIKFRPQYDLETTIREVIESFRTRPNR